MTTENKCPRCLSEKFQSVQGCSVCASCNLTEVADEFQGNTIPKWVLPYVEVTPSFLKDLAEINSGKYGPGYVSVISFPETGKSEEKPVVKRIRWSRPDRLKILKTHREPKVAANY